MELGSKIKESFESFKESLEGQQWYQELNTKWDELDPQSKTYVKFAGFGACVLLLIFITFSFMWSVHSQKKELSTKQTLLSTLTSANEELNQLKSTLPREATSPKKDSGPWSAYFESIAATSGIEKASLTISPEHSVDKGNPGDLAKESLFDVSIKHVNIKQVVRFSFALENGQRPVKLRNLTIDTKSDPSGYMDATLSVSAFTILEPK